MSKHGFFIVGFAATLAAFAAKPVGEPLASVTVPLESVTVPLESVTVNETSVRAAISPMPPSPSQWADMARSEKLSEGERLAALAKVQDQDVLFRLMFKPGCDTNLAVRVAAMKSMAEMDVIRFMAANCPDRRVCEAAHERLEAIYGKNCSRQPEQCMAIVRAYAKRMSGRK